MDVGTTSTTDKEYGTLTIRESGEEYELYDLKSESVVYRDASLEKVVTEANYLTETDLQYHE